MKKKIETEETHFTYLIRLLNEKGKQKYLKCGYTNNLNRRIEELEDKYNIYQTEILLFYVFNKKETALMMESVMRMFYKEKKGSHHILQDRFQRVKAELSDFSYFNKEALHLANRYEK